MARRAARSSSLVRELASRVAALEERVGRLETRRPPPGDGRTTRGRSAPVSAAGSTTARGGKRGARRACGGCGLPLVRRRGRCAECGWPVDA